MLIISFSKESHFQHFDTTFYRKLFNYSLNLKFFLIHCSSNLMRATNPEEISTDKLGIIISSTQINFIQGAVGKLLYFKNEQHKQYRRY